MKIHVCDIKQVGNRVYVEGIRKVKYGNNWESKYISTSFDYEYWKNNVKQLKFPVILDVNFVKGVGAQLNVKAV